MRGYTVCDVALSPIDPLDGKGIQLGHALNRRCNFPSRLVDLPFFEERIILQVLNEWYA